MFTFSAILMGFILWSLLSLFGLFLLSRKKPGLRHACADVRFVVLIPALNEGRVIGPTLRALAGSAAHTIVVIDDGSDDDTAEQVRAVRDRRIVLLQRTLPDAQQGKGEALNAAYRWLRASGVAGTNESEIILCVLDADGRLGPDVLNQAAARFADESLGAAQVAVRIRNRRATVWTRMQHFEFIAFTALYQRGRNRTGAVGLGGNGQFVRLSALSALGASPWTDCLTEDMDLGIRLRLAGWTTAYLPAAWVSQQAVPGVRRLVRQRTRWFQGSLQCLAHLPRIMLHPRLAVRAKVDLAGLLLSPVVLLVLTPIVLVPWVLLTAVAVSGGGWRGPGAETIGIMYVLAFLPAPLLAYTFWLEEPDTTLPESLALGHLFVLYGYLWMLAGWRAAGRQLFRRRGWSKTAREEEPDDVVRPHLEEVVAA